MYTDDEEIDPEIFDSLYTLHSERENISEAIVWGLIGAEFESSTVDKENLLTIAAQNGLPLEELSSRADTLHSKIESREFMFNR